MDTLNINKRKILILGFAREGQSVYKYLRAATNNKIAIFDEKIQSSLNSSANEIITKDKNLDLFLGKKIESYKNVFCEYDLWIKSAGIPNKIISCPEDVLVTSSTNIFFEKCPGKIIGITGTKGKSTTSSLIYEILKSAGEKVILVGNIGTPCLDFLDKIDKETLVVFELSSHQLSTLKKSPHIAVFLNIYPEHLDYYDSMDDYVLAKSNITKFQSKNDFLIYNAKDVLVSEIARRSQAVLLPFGDFEISSYKSNLLGDFNQRNIEAALKVAGLLQIPQNISEKAIALFCPLKHRLENIGTFKNITFYNDSLATIPEATINALYAINGDLDTLILGGYNRKLSYKKLAEKILKSKIRNLIFFPTTGQLIWQEIIKLNPKGAEIYRHFNVSAMEDAVKLAYVYTRKNKVCLLSCASASFNLFKDYVDRGDQFKKFVEKLGK